MVKGEVSQCKALSELEVDVCRHQDKKAEEMGRSLVLLL